MSLTDDPLVTFASVTVCQFACVPVLKYSSTASFGLNSIQVSVDLESLDQVHQQL